MDRHLEGEVADFVSQLGFNKISNKDVDDDFEYMSDETDTLQEKSKNVSKKNKRATSGKHISAEPATTQTLPSNGLIKEDRRGKATPSIRDTSAAARRPAKRARREVVLPPAVQHPEVSSSVEDVGDVEAADSSTSTRWYSESVTSGAETSMQEGMASQLMQEASAALNNEIKAFKASGGGRTTSQWRWTQTVLTSGTVSDKLAAREALLLARPELHLNLLDDTCRMVAAKGKGHAMAAMNLLANLFSKQMLPPHRKLKQFRQQPLGALPSITAGDAAARKRQLILWLFEDRLKGHYKEFVGRVREMAHDTVEKTRKNGVNTLALLLTAHPELEQTLLETLVNKLGDEKKSVACLAVRRLSTLLRTHPAMRTVVVKEVERILFRQNVGKRVQFYGICFLSQVQFSDEGDEPLAERIVRIYLGFFRACVKQAELDDRLMRALLTGLSGCAGRARLVTDQLHQYMQPLHHIVQLANFGVATQALLLMFQLSTADGHTEPTDRYYAALYKKLVHPGMTTSQKLSDFLNLVFRSIRRDPCLPRARAYIKRLLQSCLHQTAALACSVLLLVSELFRGRPELAVVGGQTDSAAWTADLDSDGEGRPRDVPLSDDEAAGEQQQQQQQRERDAEPTGGGQAGVASPCDGAADPVPAGWVFVAADRSAGRRRRYDPLYREPRWCRAELAALHELTQLRRHLHPSLALFAGQLIAGKPAQYSGNPLHDFQLMHFLNRFCYKNPKKTGGAAADAARQLPVSSPGYARLPEAQVPHDERFFHRYFKWRDEHGLGRAEPARPLTDAQGDVTDEAFDSFLDHFFDGKGEAGDAGEVDFMAEIVDAADDALEAEDGDEVDGGRPGLDGSEDEDNLDGMDSLGEDDGDDDDEESGSLSRSSRAFGIAGTKKKAKSADVSSLFASAEEFSELLEEGSAFADGSSQAVRGGGTSQKQLAWEAAGSGKRPRRDTSADFRGHKHLNKTKRKRGNAMRKK